MTCAEIQVELSLYLYGELDFATEEFVEMHLAECAFCQLALGREKEWHAAVNREQQDVTPEILSACRASLSEQIRNEPTTAMQAGHKIAGWWHDLLDVRFTDRSYKVAAASFLVLFGFGAGRLVSSTAWPWATKDFASEAGLIHPAVTEVQSVRPEADNRVRIVVQQMQVREVLGSRDDNAVRVLLMAAAGESVDPGVRMDSVEMLAGQRGEGIRSAIVNRIKSDPNAAVRVRAIESLKQFPNDATTIEALEFALGHDSDSGVRTEALEALVPLQGEYQVTPQLRQTITNVMESSPSDDYVYWRCAQILHQQPYAHVAH